MIDYAAILTYNYKGRQWQLDGDTYDGLTMLDNGDKPSQKELDDQWNDVQTQIANDKATVQAAKQTARAKLATLGLTEDEINALIP